MPNTALIIGNSDGIGLALTRELLNRSWTIIGVSRSESPIAGEPYTHHVIEVQQPEYTSLLQSILKDHPDLALCLYCPGIGELLNPRDMQNEVNIFEVNLTGLVKTAAVIIPAMVATGKGHLIGLSSVADDMLSPEAPSYHASKAGFSAYLESLALALKKDGVAVTNVRFGFVDTKMAQGDVKPFMMSLDQAVNHLMRCIDKQPVRYTAPKIVIPLVKFRKWMLQLKRG
ncbi:SDR family NAD(P)-dependent oxidoreductase [candidate division KSB1 bacterium]|nr:SDR family NAD(P)-dependent oxidoreductase [candidate division KSB1 bacterium]